MLVNGVILIYKSNRKRAPMRLILVRVIAGTSNQVNMRLDISRKVIIWYNLNFAHARITVVVYKYVFWKIESIE